MRLRSRLVDDEQREASYQKFRVGSLESSKATSGQLRQSGVLKGRSPSQSPSIAAKDMTEELPFEMDEDTPKRRLPSSAALPPPSLLPPSAEEDETMSSTLGQTPEITRSLLYGKGKEAVRLSSSASSNETSPIAAKPGTSINGFGASAPPWQTSPHMSRGLGLKDIMAQASSGRVSSLTQSLKQAEASSKAALRVSQKERKRQAQLQKTQALDDRDTLVVSSPKSTPSSKHSPWQTPKQQRTEPQSDANGQGNAADSAPNKASLSVRQTVAVGLSPHTPTPKTTRSSSSPVVTSSSKAIPASIQSIRHLPAPTRSGSSVDSRTPMADILSQQLTEKTAVKEAVAKRSLQEIQQEQEFQEWWDKEAQKFQEEETQSSTPASRRGRGGRGRGRQRGGGKGGVRSSEGEVASPQTPDKVAVQQTAPKERSREATGRGRGRDRGRGRGQ